MATRIAPRPALAAVLFLALVMAASAATAKRKVIIDQDAFGPGGPDMQPILMVLQARDVEVLGITIESGDGWQKENLMHTLRMLELIGRTDVPVVAGATYPLVNNEEATLRWEKLYGTLPYKGAWTREWPQSEMTRPPYHAADIVPTMPEGAPTTKPLAETAAAFLVRKVREFPGEVTVLALGPCTNLALAARLDDAFAATAKELVLMGASFSPHSATRDEFVLEYLYRPRVEFNVRWDPEAFEMTLHAGWKKITLVPLDATTATKTTPELIRAATAADTALARYVAKYAQTGFPLWDEVAVGVFLEPTLATRTGVMAVSVDLDHGANYGATLSWAAGKGPRLGEPDVTVVFEIDVRRLEKMFVALIGRK